MAKQQGQDQSVHGPSPGTVIDGRYKIVRFIGQGGNGLVHEVEHVRTGRRLALKSLVDETGTGRLEQEARATCLMRNDHAVRITDMGSTDATGPYLVMELLDGQSLRALLEEAGQIPLELTANIALQVCECLTEAHSHGIIHRDLKPENIFLSSSPWPGQYDVRVLDFGVVKITNEGPIPNSSLTRTGSTVGTPYYMSLEQLRNPSNVDARADIYALGVVLYESLSGRKPFQAETIGDLVYALCSGPPTHLGRLRPDIPGDIADAVMRALSTKREDRQTTMVELAQVLLPHANAAFGLWLRTLPKGRAAAATAATPAAPAAPRLPRTTVAMEPGPASSVTPSGINKKAPSSSPVAMPEPTAPQSAASKLLPDPEESQEPTRIRPERPAINLSGDRDTPTEMYVKGSHHDGGGITSMPLVPSGNRDTPTRGLPMPHGLGGSDDDEPRRGVDEDDASRTVRFAGAANQFDSPSGRLQMSPDGGAPPSGSTPEMLGTMRLPTSGTIDEVRAALASGAPMPTPSSGGREMLSTMRFGQDSYGGPPGSSPMQMQMGGGLPPGVGLATMPPGQTDNRPNWQRSLDSALVKVGRFFEGIVGPIAAKVRGASPKAQLVLAAVAASTVAAILVIFIYLLLG